MLHWLYEPYGATYFNKNSNQSKNNKHWFASKEVDNTNLSYIGARYYNASTARFTSPDPVSINPELPNTFNSYVYANNNPYKYVDPDGQTAKEWFADVWTGIGVGSTFGLLGQEQHKYSSAYYVGIGLGIASMGTGEGEVLAAGKIAKTSLTFSKLKTMIKTSQEPYKGSTKVGHALSKHSGRKPEVWGRMQGSMNNWNEQAMLHFREIYRGPGMFSKVTNERGISFLEKRLHDGRGIRLNKDFTFKGFID